MSSRPRPDTRRSSIVIAVAALTLMAGFVVFQTFVHPMCGQLAERQLAQASQELADQIPGLDVDGFGSECSSGDDARANWSHPDLTRFMVDAESAGCVIDKKALHDVDRPLAECRGLSRSLIFYLDDPRSRGKVSGDTELN